MLKGVTNAEEFTPSSSDAGWLRREVGSEGEERGRDGGREERRSECGREGERQGERV